MVRRAEKAEAEVARLTRERDEARAERDRLRQAHWDGRETGGFDNDGEPTPTAVVSDFCALILADWTSERESHDELMAELSAVEREGNASETP